MKIQFNPLTDQIYRHLLDRILSHELPPGSALREVDLAGQMGVSRTPVRETLSRLGEEGLVVIKPNGRSSVRRLAREELIEIFQVRTALEGLAAHCLMSAES